MDKLFRLICVFVIVAFPLSTPEVAANPTANEPLKANTVTKEVQVFGVIYPSRFNSAEGEEARYHFLVWQGGTSANALIETPADDLAFHDALVSLGAHPGDNLPMASWNKRHEPAHPAPRKNVEGSPLSVRLSWQDQPVGIPIEQAFQGMQQQGQNALLQSPVSSLSQASHLQWRFGGNRNRLFNQIPLAPRPGCLACLYSCPSGKVSNRALSVHEYIEAPSRFAANTAILPPDGTPVIVTFRVGQ